MVDFPTPIGKSIVVANRFAPKFCAECTDREIHSSYGDPFRDNFCVYVSGPLSGNFRTTFGPRDINTEMVTKVVPVRAVNFSIGAFCTEFRCEQLCDDATFWNWGAEIDHQGREIDIRNSILARESRFCKKIRNSADRESYFLSNEFLIPQFHRNRCADADRYDTCVNPIPLIRGALPSLEST